MNSEPTEVTRLLLEIRSGEQAAFDRLLPIVYDELRRIAVARVRKESAANSLQPTELVHEAFLRLVNDPNLSWSQRSHFFFAAAEAMRRILIERARRRSRIRHGGGMRQAELPDLEQEVRIEHEELLALDLALDRLQAKSVDLAGVVKLRYFAGLTIAETAKVLETSERSVNRSWAAARAWLHKEMTPVR